jgi:hemerythrin
MAGLEWSDALSVGVEEIDEDHKKLVGMLNDLDAAVTAGHGTEVVGDILENLFSYTAWHFRHEERLMQTYGDPKFLDHKAEHEHLIASTEQFQAQYADGKLDVAADLLPFLKQWLTTHILGTDKATGMFLAGEME